MRSNGGIGLGTGAHIQPDFRLGVMQLATDGDLRPVVLHQRDRAKRHLDIGRRRGGRHASIPLGRFAVVSGASHNSAVRDVDDVWAVSSYIDGAGHVQPYAVHFDGSTWTETLLQRELADAPRAIPAQAF